MDRLLKRNDQRRYKYLVLGRHTSYFIYIKKNHSDSHKNFDESDIIKILEFFFIENIHVIFG